MVKKIIYLILSTILGLLLSLIVHAAIEYGYIIWSFRQGTILTAYFNGSCFLPPTLTYGLIILGALGGLALGFWWWDLVYVKRKRFKK